MQTTAIQPHRQSVTFIV